MRARASALGELREGFECGLRAAEPIEQRAEGSWADILAPDEAQPVATLRVGEPDPAPGD